MRGARRAHEIRTQDKKTNNHARVITACGVRVRATSAAGVRDVAVVRRRSRTLRRARVHLFRCCSEVEPVKFTRSVLISASRDATLPVVGSESQRIVQRHKSHDRQKWRNSYRVDFW